MGSLGASKQWTQVPMSPPPLSPKTLNALHREADRYAMRIVGICRIAQHEREDLRQELLTELLRRLKHFDPGRGSLGAFATVCLAHQATRLTRRILRGRLATPISLDAPIAGGNGLTLVDTLAEEDGYGALMGQVADAAAASDRRLDLDRALTSLPAAQLRHCLAMANEDRGAARDSVGSRSTAFRRTREVRLNLLARGIGAVA